MGVDCRGCAAPPGQKFGGAGTPQNVQYNLIHILSLCLKILKNKIFRYNFQKMIG